MQISITIKGGPELKAKLEKLGSSLTDFTKEFETMGQQLVSYLGNEVYLSEGQVFGSRWSPLSQAYATEKAKKYPGHRVLDASGLMKQSYYAVTSSQAATIRNRQEYAQYHQTGTRKMPRRLLFAFSNAMLKTIKDVITAGINDKLRSV